jgi:O-antigen/teichoic acid export membrane protein
LPLQPGGTSVMAQLRRAPETVRFAALMYVGTLAYSFSFLVARYSVLKNHGESQAGLLQAGLAIGLAMIAVLSPANGWFLSPIMNRNIAKDDKIRAAAEFQKKLIIPLSAASMVIVLFPGLVLLVLYSPQFLVAAQFVFLFVLWQWVSQVAAVHLTMLIGFDDLKAYAIVMGFGYGCSALGSWLLAPLYGIGGVGVAFIAGDTVRLLSSGWRLRSRHGLRLSVDLHLLICYSLAAIAAVGFLFRQHQELTIPVVLAKCGVYMVFLAGLLCFFTREARMSLHSLWQKVRLRGTP